jgi:hypothetical protein
MVRNVPCAVVAQKGAYKMTASIWQRNCETNTGQKNTIYVVMDANKKEADTRVGAYVYTTSFETSR